MRKGRWWLASGVGALAVVLGASIAMAAGFEDGAYTLTLPGIGEFEYTVDSGGGEPVMAMAAPDGYEVDDDDPDKAAWKNAASLEVEAKLDRVEGDYDWAEEGDAVLTLADGGTVAITAPNGDGAFTVSTSGGWWAFGNGSDWYVANADDIESAEEIFKVEATEDGVEIKAVDGADDGFLNDLDEEEEEVEAQEIEAEEDDDDGGGKGRGRNPNK